MRRSMLRSILAVAILTIAIRVLGAQTSSPTASPQPTVTPPAGEKKTDNVNDVLIAIIGGVVTITVSVIAARWGAKKVGEKGAADIRAEQESKQGEFEKQFREKLLSDYALLEQAFRLLITKQPEAESIWAQFSSRYVSHDKLEQYKEQSRRDRGEHEGKVKRELGDYEERLKQNEEKLIVASANAFTFEQRLNWLSAGTREGKGKARDERPEANAGEYSQIMLERLEELKKILKERGSPKGDE